jgi:uncharacterized protein (DUF1800 family)
MASPRETLERFQPATAWAAYFPHGGEPWDLAKVAHLHRRAAFGADWPRLQADVQRRPGDVIDELLKGGPGQQEFDAEADALEAAALDTGEVRTVQAAWVYRLIHSPHPLGERMTLFWHDHFATSQAKVQNVRLMQRQVAVFRRHALGRFGVLLDEMARDPAMLVWLDATSNRRGNPNENLAREIFELFSLGVGNYTEEDIKQAARALTGWSVAGEEAAFDPAAHDDGEKTIFGQTGRWNAGDVVRLALMQPACARFLVRKLFRAFVSETAEPTDAMLAPLADGFRLRNYDVAWLLKTMLSSWAFYSAAVMRQCVKSPVGYLVGTARSFGGGASPREVAEALRELDQELFFPPSVKGWDGGTDWIDPAALRVRQNLAYDLTSGSGGAERCDPAHLAVAQNLRGEDETLRFFLRLLLQVDDHPARSELIETLRRERGRHTQARRSSRAIDGYLARAAAHLVMSLPDYQLA